MLFSPGQLSGTVAPFRPGSSPPQRTFREDAVTAVRTRCGVYLTLKAVAQSSPRSTMQRPDWLVWLIAVGTESPTLSRPYVQRTRPSCRSWLSAWCRLIELAGRRLSSGCAQWRAPSMGKEWAQPTAIVLSGGPVRCTNCSRSFGVRSGACSEWSWCDRSSKSLDFFSERLVFVNTSKLMRLGQIRGQRSIVRMDE